MKPVKFKDGTMKVDLFTASAITQVYNKVNTDNKKKLEMVNGTKGQFQAMSSKIMKMVGKYMKTFLTFHENAYGYQFWCDGSSDVDKSFMN